MGIFEKKCTNYCPLLESKWRLQQFTFQFSCTLDARSMSFNIAETFAKRETFPICHSVEKDICILYFVDMFITQHLMYEPL